MTHVIEIVDTIDAVPRDQWNNLAGPIPFLRHEFLQALEQTGAVGGETGWQTCPMLLKSGDELVGAVPLYLKYHSYGEYVFDWSWADAYERNGLPYYPKLLAAIPFTPITSARLLANSADEKAMLLQGLSKVLFEQSFSSAHINFPDPASEAVLDKSGWLKRKGVQFRWENQGYDDLDAFLMTLNQPKRKKIRQERKKVSKEGVDCRVIKGKAITENDWAFFYRCYEQTYLDHHSTPYLNLAFFIKIGQIMPDNVVLFLAERDGESVAASLCFYDQKTLYGRYWGAVSHVPNLHFELCYYQAQEFCINEGIQFFEGGAQGEHKLARGFTARPTCSFHLIAHPDFSKAIQTSLLREKVGLDAYVSELEDRSPFKPSE